MKPKERYYNYIRSRDGGNNNCQNGDSATKEDSPIDLSTKRHSPTTNSHSPVSSSDYDSHSINAQASINCHDWSPLTKNLHSPSNLLPYLLLQNPSCNNVPLTLRTNTAIEETKTAPKNNIIYDHHGNSYSVVETPFGNSIIPLRESPSRSSPHSIEEHNARKVNAFERALINNSNTSDSRKSSTYSSSSSSPSSSHHSPPHHDYNETRRLLGNSPPTGVALSSTVSDERVNGSHHNPIEQHYRNNLTRTNSSPTLHRTDSIKFTNIHESLLHQGAFEKSKSENDLLKICDDDEDNEGEDEENEEREQIVSGQVPRITQKLNVMGKGKRERNEPPRKCTKYETKSKNHRKLHPAAIHVSGDSDDEDDDEEDMLESGGSDDYGSDDALDLRITNSIPAAFKSQMGVALAHPNTERIFHHINSLLSQPIDHKDPSFPAPTPLELYRQYYYYLMHQPAFASRAAVAVAETYAKIMTSTNQAPNDFNDENASKYESENSPDYMLNGSKAELRSADTTNGNGIPLDRKRISRPLTGKHVRHGTGASPATLVTLRNMIQERQRLKEIGSVSLNIGKGKGGRRVKRK